MFSSRRGSVGFCVPIGVSGLNGCPFYTGQSFNTIYCRICILSHNRKYFLYVISVYVTCKWEDVFAYNSYF